MQQIRRAGAQLTSDECMPRAADLTFPGKRLPLSRMKRALLLAVWLSAFVAGCSSGPGSNVQHHAPATFASAADFDAYVQRRTDDLLRMGATKYPSEAALQARIDAERRYGRRMPTDSATLATTRRTSAPLKMSAIDAALARAARK